MDRVTEIPTVAVVVPRPHQVSIPCSSTTTKLRTANFKERSQSAVCSFSLAVIFLFLSILSAAGQQQLPSDVAALEHASEIDVGAFCLSAISPGAGVIKVGQSHLNADGSVWWEVRIHVGAGDSKKPNAYFYSKLRVQDTHRGVSHCSDTADLAFLKGRLNSATINGYYRPGTHVPPPAQSESPRWLIDAGKLDVEFGNAEAQIGPLFGATVIANDAPSTATSLTRRRLEVTNPSKELFFDQSNGEQTGILQVSTTDVILSKAQIVVGSKPVSINLACRYLNGPKQGSVSFTRNVSTGEAALVAGECSTTGVDFPPDDWNQANLTTSVTSAHSAKVTLIGGPVQSEVRILGLDLQTSKLTYEPGEVRVVPSSIVKVDSLQGSVKNSPDELRLSKGTWNGLKASGDFSLGSSFPIDGTGVLTLSRLSGEIVDASFVLSAANLPGLVSIAPMKISSLALKMVGPPAAPFITGSLDAASIQLAALGLQQKIGPISFQSDPGAKDRTTFTFDLDLSSPEGHFTLGDPTGENVRVKGELKKLHAKGNLKLASASVEPTITISPGGLVLDAAVEASVSPLVLGSPVQFVGAQITLGSPGGLTLSKSRAAGKLDLDAKALIIATPSLVFANPDQGFIVQAPMRTDGAATIQFDLGSGRAAIRNGRIVADKLEARALDTAKSVSISGITLIAPVFTIEKLIVSFTEGQGLIQGTALHFVTDSMTHPGSPYWDVALKPDLGLSLPEFDAHVGDTDKSLQIVDATIEGLKLDGISAKFRSEDGFEVSGSTFHIAADRLSDKTITNGTVSIANGGFGVATADGPNHTNAKAAFDNFNLTLDGAKENLSGTGSIHLHDISVGARYTLPIAPCGRDAAGLPIGWKVTGAFDISKVDIDLHMKSSRVDGTADVNEGKAYIVNDGESSCGWNQPYTIVEEQWADVNFCPPWSCHVKTIVVPAIKGDIYWQADLIKLDASATIQQASISVGRGSAARVCLTQLNLSPPVIIATYSPQINKGGFIADFVHNLIRTIAASIESPIASSIGTSVSFTSYLSTALGTVCTR